MLRLAVLGVLLAAVCAVPITDDSGSGDHDAIVVNNIHDYFAESQQVDLFEQLPTEELKNSDGIVKKVYKFGKSVRGTCDKLSF